METLNTRHYQLLLMRHAQALPISAALPDVQRPLTQQGIHQAKQMRSLFREHHLMPDQILCSSSLHTQETAQHLGYTSAQITPNKELYGALASEILSLISAIPSCVKTLLVVAHNPSISQLASRLAGRFLGDFAPATCVILDFEFISWSKIDSSCPVSVTLHSPFTSTS